MACVRTVCTAEKVPLSTEAEPRLLVTVRNVKGRSPNHNQAGSPWANLQREISSETRVSAGLGPGLDIKASYCLSTNYCPCRQCVLNGGLIIPSPTRTMPLQSCNLSLPARLAWRVVVSISCESVAEIEFFMCKGEVCQRIHTKRENVTSTLHP